MSNAQEKTIFAELWNRRVPQFAATYIGISWGILQFLIFATNRYGLNHSIVDKFLLFAALLIPAVLVYIYNHGSPGKDEWKKYEKVLIPLNLIIALVFAGLFSPGNEMNASPVEVQVTNEEGDTVTRLVPSSKQTKSLAVFPLQNTGDSENDWLKFAIAQVITKDLEQDMRMYCLGPFSFDYLFKANNSSIESNDIPFSKYLNIAQEQITDYFLTGEFSGSANDLKVRVRIYETQSGNLFFEKDIPGKGIYEFVDNFTKEFSGNLFLDDSSDRIVMTDLPAAELITSDIEALKAYINARKTATIEDNIKGALSSANDAVKNDPSSPMLQAYLANCYYKNGVLDSSKVIIEKAVDLSETLPERQKFNIRQQYYIYNQEVDKNTALFETWKKLYPADFKPYEFLITFYAMTQNITKAKETALDALDNGHGPRVLKRLADYEITQGNLDKAEKYINDYYKLFPGKNKLEDTQLADIYLKKSEFDKAEKWYENILILNPRDFNIMLKLSDVYSRQWDFDKAESILYDALEKTNILDDSLTVYQNMIFHYFRTGQVDEFKDVAYTHYKALERNTNQMSAGFQHLQMAGVYAIMGQKDFIYSISDTFERAYPQFKSTFDCVADFVISMVEEDKETFTSTYSGFCKDILLRGTPTMSYMAEGLQAKMNGDYSEAIRFLETYIDTTGSDSDIMGSMVAESYRLNGQYDKAISYCEKSLRIVPSDAFTLLELAKAHAAKGNKKKAKNIVNDIKTKILFNSDERFMIFRVLEEFEKELISS